MGLLFTAFWTLAATGYGWLNPVFGLLVYYCFAVLRPPSLWWWSVGQHSTRFLMMVAVSTLIGWGLKSFGMWSRLRYIKLPLFGLGLYLLSGLVATIFKAINPTVAWTDLTVQLKIGLVILVACTLFTDAKSIKALVWVVTLSYGYMALNLNQQYLEGPGFLFYHGFGGIDNNGAAMIMVMGVPFAMLMGLNAKRWWLKGICIFGALCLIHVVLFSFSRGGMLGLAMVGFMTFVAILVALPRKGLTLIVGVLLVSFAITMAGKEVRARFMTIFASEENRDASAESRFTLWAAGWQAMKDNPFGLGPRNFNLVGRQYGLGRNASIHNLYLQTGADYGFAGMIGLMIFYFSAAWKTFRMSLSPTAKRLGWPRFFGQMCTISLAGFTVCSTFIGMESVEHGFIIATIGLCTVSYVRNLADQESAHRLEPVPELVDVPVPDYQANSRPELGLA